jgi:glycosyltransferase involved in cell wall biosynthesis
MKILQVCTHDIGGGAEKVALELCRSYRSLGHDSWLAVGYKKTTEEYIFEIPVLPSSTGALAQWIWSLHKSLDPLVGRVRGIGRLKDLLEACARPRGAINRWKGIEDFDFPSSKNILSLPPRRPDIVHLHNLHGYYFDLRYLAELSQRIPVVITMHDEWLYTGHCAYTFGCERWQIGCGQCPDLTIYPSLKRDGTAWNWQRKQKIYANSNLYIAAPSQWLIDNLEKSKIMVLEKRVIPYGVDLSIFRPIPAEDARLQLGLPPDAFILLFVANMGKNNPYKDYSTIEKAIMSLETQGLKRNIEVIVLGGYSASQEMLGNVKVHSMGFQREPNIVAKFYQAADIYLHAARAENFPNTILEALACGTPVIATAVGGIPEQINPNETGFLIPPGDYQAMAARIRQLLKDEALRSVLSKRARDIAIHKYNQKDQVANYLKWYQEILDRQNAHK